MAALRKLALRITWDGQPQPAVWCPLGDFFGTAPGVNLYKTLLTGMTDEGFYSYWYMPFAKQRRGRAGQRGHGRPRAWSSRSSTPRWAGRSTAWATSTPSGIATRSSCPTDRWPDWLMLQTQGRGRFCGVMLHVWNPRGGWWGEGDEKFFVDGEKFPSTFGTGSEDYFGYAWGNPHLFQKPYHAQTMTQNNRGHQSRAPLAHRRQRALPEVVRGLHREVLTIPDRA